MVPKISAPSVKEHHSMMFVKLVDAAEEILRGQGPAALTAGAVAAQAGIARNSIYRYVDSVDDLRILVLERYLPAWGRRLSAALDAEGDPFTRLSNLIALSLDIGAESGHQWLIDVATFGRSKATQTGAQIQGRSGAVMNFHVELARNVTRLWREISPDNAAINAQLTRSILDAGLKLIDQGAELGAVKNTVNRTLAALAGTRATAS